MSNNRQDAISIKECMQRDIQDFHRQKDEIDAEYSRICKILEEHQHEVVENDAEFEQLYHKIAMYKNAMKQIVQQMRNLANLMRKGVSSVGNASNASSAAIISPHLTKWEEEERQIDEIIRPFLLPILLRSFYIQNSSNTQ